MAMLLIARGEAECYIYPASACLLLWVLLNFYCTSNHNYTNDFLKHSYSTAILLPMYSTAHKVIMAFYCPFDRHFTVHSILLFYILSILYSPFYSPFYCDSEWAVEWVESQFSAALAMVVIRKQDPFRLLAWRCAITDNSLLHCTNSNSTFNIRLINSYVLCMH